MVLVPVSASFFNIFTASHSLRVGRVSPLRAVLWPAAARRGLTRPTAVTNRPRIFACHSRVRTVQVAWLFETDGRFVHLYHGQTSGNPVKIGDGCATVRGYRLPQATAQLDASMSA